MKIRSASVQWIKQVGVGVISVCDVMSLHEATCVEVEEEQVRSCSGVKVQDYSVEIQVMHK